MTRWERWTGARPGCPRPRHRRGPHPPRDAHGIGSRGSGLSRWRPDIHRSCDQLRRRVGLGGDHRWNGALDPDADKLVDRLAGRTGLRRHRGTRRHGHNHVGASRVRSRGGYERTGTGWTTDPLGGRAGAACARRSLYSVILREFDASLGDAARLAGFTCSTGAPFEVDVETWIRSTAVQWLNDIPRTRFQRRSVGLVENEDELVAVVAWHDIARIDLEGIWLEVLAVSVDSQHGGHGTQAKTSRSIAFERSTAMATISPVSSTSTTAEASGFSRPRSGRQWQRGATMRSGSAGSDLRRAVTGATRRQRDPRSGVVSATLGCEGLRAGGVFCMPRAPWGASKAVLEFWCAVLSGRATANTVVRPGPRTLRRRGRAVVIACDRNPQEADRAGPHGGTVRPLRARLESTRASVAMMLRA